jgi:hypothetical protein
VVLRKVKLRCLMRSVQRPSSMHQSRSFGRFFIDPAGWGRVFDIRIGVLEPPGPTVAGQKIEGETCPRLIRLKLAFEVIQIDAERHRLVMDIEPPFGVVVREELTCTPLTANDCRVDYRCGFDFPKGWRGALTRVLMRREVNADPVDSLSRLKRVAEMRVAGGENAGRQQEERSWS